MKKLKLIINPDGSFVLEHHGQQGAACTKDTEQILKGVARKTSDRKKPEYYYEKTTLKETR